MEHLSDHELAWANAKALEEGKEPTYRPGTGIPANDPPGTRYHIWYTDLSDKGYKPNAQPRKLTGTDGLPSFWSAMHQACQFSRKGCYPVGYYNIVPVGEIPGGNVGYSGVSG